MALRRLLVPLTAVWLSCQIGTVTLVPVALWIAAVDADEECTCGHGPGAMCPMHHKPSRSSVPCAMRAANDSGAAVLTTLVGAVGLLPEVSHSIQPAASNERPRAGDVHLAGVRPVPPDPPPPRV